MMPLAFAHAANPSFLNEQAYNDQVRAENYKEISAQNLPAIREIIFSQFKTEQDHQYFEKVVQTFKPYKIRISKSEKNQTISIFGESFDITLSEVNSDNKSLKINDQPFRFTDGQSLETAVTEITTILGKRQTQVPGLMPLLLGQEAHAIIPLLAAGAGGITVLTTTGVLPSAVNEVRIFALTDSLEVMTKACKTRKSGAIYEKSQAYWMLGKVSSGKPAFSLEEQRQITDCKKWAAEGILKGYVDSAKSLQKLCERGREAQKCMDEFKAASDVNTKKPAPNKATSTAQ